MIHRGGGGEGGGEGGGVGRGRGAGEYSNYDLLRRIEFFELPFSLLTREYFLGVVRVEYNFQPLLRVGGDIK